MARVRLSMKNLQSADLPPVCVICGRAADLSLRKTFQWRPQRLFTASIVRMLLLCTIVSWPILFVISETRKRRATVDLPICRRHRRYWIWRSFWILAPLLVLVASTLVATVLVLLGVIPLAGIYSVVVSLIMIFIVWAVAALIAEQTGLRAIEITRDDLILAGAHAVFADLAQRGRHAWQESEHLDNGWEEYDPYPRKPPATAK
jgi:hypothetical protein